MHPRRAAKRGGREAIKGHLARELDYTTTSAGEPERALVVGAEVRGHVPLLTVADSLDELEQLACTAGVSVVGRTSQRLEAINPATYVGSGKVEEIKAFCQELSLDLVIFDDELSPAQLRNLEEALETKVLDRTALILDIFARHARTREGALQVELAQYSYRLPRLTHQWTHLSRQTVGGVGLRGPGETQLEIDRREISRRMGYLRRELDHVRRQRAQQRRRRRRAGMPVVAIVGYTNAGKSTLLNRLAAADVQVADLLFATLDPTTRKVSLPSGKEVLFTDTVGFIQKLPTQLVAAFRATLEEVEEADVLLHVADISDRNLRSKIEAVNQVLREIGAADKPTIVALNKVDLVDPETELSSDTGLSMRHSTLAELSGRYAHIVPVSGQQGVGIEDLLATVEAVLAGQMVELDLVLPYRAGDLLDLWHKQGVVESTEYKPTGIRVRGRLPTWLAGLMTSSVPPGPRSARG